jgi:hypothetical protein
VSSSRYLMAVIVGLSVGVAIGWVSGRESQPAPRVAAGHHRGHHARQRTAPFAPPTQNRTPRQPALTFRQVQLRVAQCLVGSGSLEQQVVCLRRLLRSRVGSGVPGLPSDLSPFLFPGGQSGYG